MCSNLMIYSNLGRWQVKNVKPTANGEAQEVKIKVRINNNGVILVTSANLVDKKAVKAAEEPTPADNSSGSTENGNNMDTQEVSRNAFAKVLICRFFVFLVSFAYLFLCFN